MKRNQPPRSDRLSWDEYFMGVARIVAKRSADPNTQVGSIVVNRKNRIVGTGYNGMPCGCTEDAFPWDKHGPYVDTKYAYVAHSELNTLAACVSLDLEGATIYVTLYPCPDCTKNIIQHGIKRVVYGDMWDNENVEASERMFEAAGVVCEQYKPSGKTLVIDL
jgi:dCMP deaminase